MMKETSAEASDFMQSDLSGTRRRSASRTKPRSYLNKDTKASRSLAASFALNPNNQTTHYCTEVLYRASVAALTGSHQARYSVYQAMVWSRPSEKSVCLGAQPSSRRSLALSMA